MLDYRQHPDRYEEALHSTNGAPTLQQTPSIPTDIFSRAVSGKSAWQLLRNISPHVD